jgi:hypothetical protein
MTSRWDELFAIAYKLIDHVNRLHVLVTDWSFGGGTAMMLQINHRESHDVDIFLDDPQLLPRRAQNFGWLKNPEKARIFLPELDAFILALPVIGIAAVNDRPGYVLRYREKYNDRLWLMCKSAYSILIERAAKFADSQGRTLRVYFEESGEHEDRELLATTRL